MTGHTDPMTAEPVAPWQWVRPAPGLVYTGSITAQHGQPVTALADTGTRDDGTLLGFTTYEVHLANGARLSNVHATSLTHDPAPAPEQQLRVLTDRLAATGRSHALIVEELITTIRAAHTAGLSPHHIADLLGVDVDGAPLTATPPATPTRTPATPSTVPGTRRAQHR